MEQRNGAGRPGLTLTSALDSSVALEGGLVFPESQLLNLPKGHLYPPGFSEGLNTAMCVEGSSGNFLYYMCP